MAVNPVPASDIAVSSTIATDDHLLASVAAGTRRVAKATLQTWLGVGAEPTLGRVEATPEDFGAAGDGVTDDTAAIVDWLEAGGMLTANGSYLIAAAGADAGGAYATITRSIWFRAGPQCKFIAGTNLDNDLIRITPDTTSYSANPDLLPFVIWEGGYFDLRGQRNSTSVPYSGPFPPANVGSSSTTTGLSISGSITVDAVVVAGLRLASVCYAHFNASDDRHWETAGSDQHIYISGARISIANYNEFTGARDLGIYISGLSSGDLNNSSGEARGNVFNGCMFGVAVKRYFSRVSLCENRGFNTAVVVLATPVTDGSTNCIIANNYGYQAWKVVRADDLNNSHIYGNQSVSHGHRLEDGTLPASIFNSDNAVVALAGCQNNLVHNNVLISVTDASISPDVVRLEILSAQKSASNMVHDNFCRIEAATVAKEISGGADFNRFWRNFGDFDGQNPVSVDGANSIDHDAPQTFDTTADSVTGTTSITTLKTITVKANRVVRSGNYIKFNASGAFTGGSGTKTITILMDGTAYAFPATSSGLTGTFLIEGQVVATGSTSTRYMFKMQYPDGNVITLNGTDAIALDADWTIAIRGTLSNSGDNIALSQLLAETRP